MKRIAGILKIYVDDLQGFAHHSVAESDQATAQKCLRAFFGSKAVAPKSITPCSEADILGWRINLFRASIRPSDRGCRKLLWAFFLVPIRANPEVPLLWPLPQCQLIASLANRYSIALRGMSMFVQPLNELLAGTSLAHRSPTSSARFCVEVWRAIACILANRPDELAVPLQYLVPAAGNIATYGLVTDAGPECIGIALFQMGPDGEFDPAQCICYTDFPTIGWNEATQDPRYQNTREYCGAVLGILLALDAQAGDIIPPGPIHLHWYGDNTSALSWIDRNRMKSAQTQQIFMVYTWFRLKTAVDIPWTSHKPGDTMGDIDRLSRQQLLTSLNPLHRTEFRNRETLEALFELIDPAGAPKRTANDHHEAFLNIYYYVSRLLASA